MRCVDLFAGAGGLTLGLELAGLEVVAGVEHWSPAIATYEANFDHPVLDLDLAQVEEAVAALKRFSPDVVAGGPPCQDFSSAGKRDETLGRADLTVKYSQIVAAMQPIAFIMENVARARTSRSMSVARTILHDAGYGLAEAVVDASRVGVPQTRKRFFMVGLRAGEPKALQELLDGHARNPGTTMRDYFGDRLGTEYIYRHPRSYARRGIFSIDEPSPTVRGVNRPIPDGYPGHPGDPVGVGPAVRPLTTAERAEVQSFPTDFVWEGTKTEREQQIGNAVPPLLGRFVGRCLLKAMDRVEAVGTP